MYGVGVGDGDARSTVVGVAMGEDNMTTLFDMFSAVINFFIDSIFRFAQNLSEYV